MTYGSQVGFNSDKSGEIYTSAKKKKQIQTEYGLMDGPGPDPVTLLHF